MHLSVQKLKPNLEKHIKTYFNKQSKQEDLKAENKRKEK